MSEVQFFKLKTLISISAVLTLMALVFFLVIYSLEKPKETSEPSKPPKPPISVSDQTFHPKPPSIEEILNSKSTSTPLTDSEINQILKKLKSQKSEEKPLSDKEIQEILKNL